MGVFFDQVDMAIELARSRAELMRGASFFFIEFITIKVARNEDFKEALSYLREKKVMVYCKGENTLEIHGFYDSET